MKITIVRRTSVQDEIKLEREHLVEAVVVIKVAVMVGIIASYFVPQDTAVAVGIGSNLLWLWKT